jgi:uncharacterized protein (DUF58 family)
VVAESSKPLPVSRFHRWLFKSYRRGSWLSFFLASRVTRAAWLLMSMLVLSAVLGADLLRSTLYQIFVFLIAMLAVAVLWAWLRRSRLKASRHLPQYATAGESCSYMMLVKNVGRSVMRGGWMWDRPPDPRPDLRSFALSKEPGEDQRNFFDRRFIYYRWRWLMEMRNAFSGGRSQRMLTVRPGRTEQVRIDFVPQRRGVVQFRDPRVLLPDPFGLFQRCRKVQAPVDQLIVLPKRYRLPPLNLPGDACFQLGGEAVTNTIGLSGEFLGLRDYRSGDALRHIHWKGWAKTGRPIVKEFENTYFPRYGLVLDNCVESGDEEVFEEAVSVAASFASAIDTKRSLLDLMFIKDEAIVMTAGQGLAKAEKMLEVLAGVEAEREENFESLQRLVRSYRDEFSACLCVFPGWTPERADFVQGLARSGLQMICMVVCRDRIATEALMEQDPVPCRRLVLETGSIQTQLMAL